MERSWSSRSIRTNAATGWKGGESRDARAQFKNKLEILLPQCKLIRRVVDGKGIWVWEGLSLNGNGISQSAKVGGKTTLSKKGQIIHEKETEATSTDRLAGSTWLDENREVEE